MTGAPHTLPGLTRPDEVQRLMQSNSSVHVELKGVLCPWIQIGITFDCLRLFISHIWNYDTATGFFQVSLHIAYMACPPHVELNVCNSQVIRAYFSQYSLQSPLGIKFCVVDIAALSHAGAKSTHPAYVVKLQLTVVHEQEQQLSHRRQAVGLASE
jgi:hypothetical protein